MSSDYQLSIPDRNEDEDDVTKKQRAFIYSLYEAIDLDKDFINIKELGKMQASSLISQLIELRDEGVEVDSFNKSTEQGPTFLLGLGIFVAPYIFSWVTLLPKYSKKTKVISFIWLAVFALSMFSSNT